MTVKECERFPDTTISVGLIGKSSGRYVLCDIEGKQDSAYVYLSAESARDIGEYMVKLADEMEGTGAT